MAVAIVFLLLPCSMSQASRSISHMRFTSASSAPGARIVSTGEPAGEEEPEEEESEEVVAPPPKRVRFCEWWPWGS